VVHVLLGRAAHHLGTAGENTLLQVGFPTQLFGMCKWCECGAGHCGGFAWSVRLLLRWAKFHLGTPDENTLVHYCHGGFVSHPLSRCWDTHLQQGGHPSIIEFGRVLLNSLRSTWVQLSWFSFRVTKWETVTSHAKLLELDLQGGHSLRQRYHGSPSGGMVFGISSDARKTSSPPEVKVCQLAPELMNVRL
jgi:hypothetical protein